MALAGFTLDGKPPVVKGRQPPLRLFAVLNGRASPLRGAEQP
jgi:hypothetical protein